MYVKISAMSANGGILDNFGNDAIGEEVRQEIASLLDKALELTRDPELSWIIGRLAKIAHTSNEAAVKEAGEARHDVQTGLLNLRGLHDAYDSMCRELSYPNERRASALSAIVVFTFDVKNFKAYNDRCTWVEGTRLLRRIGELLESTVREWDVVARIGGDEFVVIISVLKSEVTSVSFEECQRQLHERFAQVFESYEDPVWQEFQLRMRYRSFVVTPKDCPTLLEVLDATEVKAKR